ncbi:MAG: PorV/PorQ family protein [Candidatus Cloacimonadota bacterium]|nr:PorV/PorQ family protein [Candidatus Cloacimonadota bacterium]
MNKKIKLILCLGLFISFAVVSTIPAYAGSEATCIFLLIEPGSRPGGMGHSYVSIAEGGIASWWNPGGLAFIKHSDIDLMHSNWFGDVIDDMYYEYLGYVQYFEGIGSLGLNVTYMTYGESEARDKNGDYLCTFTSYEIAIGAVYGTEIKNDLGIGINIKGIISGLCPPINMGDSQLEGTGYTFVVDMGLLKKNFIIPRLSCGINIQNFGPDMTYANSENSQPMPLNLRAGFSYKILDSKYNKMTASADINKMLVKPEDPLWKRWFTSLYDDDFQYEIDSMIENIGVEYKYYNLISLRAGYVNDVAGHIRGVSFGGGISYEFSKGKELSFDFALQPAGELTTNNKTFSLGIKF